MPIKIAVIGAGSIGFTRRLMRDILSVPELADSEFAFHDINKHNLEMIAQLAKRDIKANGLPAKLSTSTQRRRALDGAERSRAAGKIAYVIWGVPFFPATVAAYIIASAFLIFF